MARSSTRYHFVRDQPTMTVPLQAWGGTLTVFVLIAANLVVTTGADDSGLRAATMLSALSITAGLAFGRVL